MLVCAFGTIGCLGDRDGGHTDGCTAWPDVRAAIAQRNARVVRLTLPRWNTVIAFNGALGRRMRGAYIRESIALNGARMSAGPF